MGERPGSPADRMPRVSLSPALALALGGIDPEIQPAGSEVSSLRSPSPGVAGANDDLPEGAAWDGALGPPLADAPAPGDVVADLDGGAGSPGSIVLSDRSSVTVPLPQEIRRTIEARHETQRNARRTVINVLHRADHPCFEAGEAAEGFYGRVEEFAESVTGLWAELDWWMRETIEANPDEGEDAARELRWMEREMEKVKQGIDSALKAAKEMTRCGERVVSDTVDLYWWNNFAALRDLRRDMIYGDDVARMLREDGVVDDDDEGE